MGTQDKHTLRTYWAPHLSNSTTTAPRSSRHFLAVPPTCSTSSLINAGHRCVCVQAPERNGYHTGLANKMRRWINNVRPSIFHVTPYQRCDRINEYWRRRTKARDVDLRTKRMKKISAHLDWFFFDKARRLLHEWEERNECDVQTSKNWKMWSQYLHTCAQNQYKLQR